MDYGKKGIRVKHNEQHGDRLDRVYYGDMDNIVSKTEICPGDYMIDKLTRLLYYNKSLLQEPTWLIIDAKSYEKLKKEISVLTILQTAEKIIDVATIMGLKVAIADTINDIEIMELL